MYEGMVGNKGWSMNDEMRSVGPLQPLTIAHEGFVKLLEEVHALHSYLATGAEGISNRLPSYYILARRRGWLSI